MLHMPRLWSQTVGMSDQSKSRKDQKSLPLVGQSNQKKTHAMVTMSHEDGEQAFKCVNVERPRPGGNSKKSSLSRLANNDKTIYSAAHHDQNNDGQFYTGVGKLNERPVKVL